MNSPVGEQCSVSQQRIASELDGRYCQACSRAFHIDALDGEAAVCPICLRSFEDTASEKSAREEGDAQVRDQRLLRKKLWVIVIAGVALCMIPFIVGYMRALAGVDTSIYGEVPRFSISMVKVAESPVRWFWPSSILVFVWGWIAALKGTARRSVLRIVISLVFVIVASAMAYDWIVRPLLKEAEELREQRREEKSRSRNLKGF